MDVKGICQCTCKKGSAYIKLDLISLTMNYNMRLSYKEQMFVLTCYIECYGVDLNSGVYESANRDQSASQSFESVVSTFMVLRERYNLDDSRL